MSNTSIELINYAKDLDYEYNMKLLIMLIFLGSVCLFTWYMHNRYRVELFSQYLLKKLGLGLSYGIIFTIPLWIPFLARTVSLSFILRMLFFMYGIAFTGGFIYFFIFGGEKIYNFFSGKSFYKNKMRGKYK